MDFSVFNIFRYEWFKKNLQQNDDYNFNDHKYKKYMKV